MTRHRMRTGPGRAIGIVFAGLWLVDQTALAAPPSSTAAVQGQNGQAISMTGAGARRLEMTLAALTALPAVAVELNVQTSHGTEQGSFGGPLLWTLLVRSGLVDPAKPRSQVPQTVLITGRDGYTAAVAVGEISPALEAKAVIVADRRNGVPLDAGHLQLIVSGDKRGGRDVHDIVGIAVLDPSMAFLPAR